MDKGTSTTDPIAEARHMPLKDWLTLIFNPPKGKLILRVAFPTDEHREEYLATIDKRSEEDVYRLLNNFLIWSGTLGIFDQIELESLLEIRKVDPDGFKRRSRTQYHRRLILNAA